MTGSHYVIDIPRGEKVSVSQNPVTGGLKIIVTHDPDIVETRFRFQDQVQRACPMGPSILQANRDAKKARTDEVHEPSSGVGNHPTPVGVVNITGGVVYKGTDHSKCNDAYCLHATRIHERVDTPHRPDRRDNPHAAFVQGYQLKQTASSTYKKVMHIDRQCGAIVNCLNIELDYLNIPPEQAWTHNWCMRAACWDRRPLQVQR
jgi:hypothetical protein